MADAPAPSLAVPPSRLEAAEALARDAWKLDGTQLRPWAGLFTLPVNVAALAAGLFLNRTWAAIVVVGAVVTVGFGAFHQLTRYRLAPMALALVGFAASAWVGAVVGRRDLASALAVAGVWGAALGVATSLGAGAWWVDLQCTIALFISGGYPAGVWPSTERALLILAGGSLQIGLTAALWRLRRERFIATEITEPFAWGLAPSHLGIRFPLGNLGLRYTVRVTGVLLCATLIEHYWRWRNGYWIPMTAAIVIKTDLPTTVSRGIARLTGTVAGAGIATLLLALVRPPPTALALLVVAALCAAFALQKVNYGLFAACITVYVVCVLSLGGLPGPTAALRRTLATLIGASLALGSFIVLRPGRPPSPNTSPRSAS